MLDLVEILDDLFAALEVEIAELRQRELARGSVKESDAEPFFETKKMPNCHSLSLHPDGKRLAVVATNGGSNGNGRNLKDGKYPGNWSPIFVLAMP